MNILRSLRIAPALAAAAAAIGLLQAAPGQAQELRAEAVATGLEHPWALAFLPEGGYLVTERGGRMKVVDASGKIGAALAGVPEVVAGGQGGLLDLVLDSQFSRNRTLYFCFSQPGQGGNTTALAKARLAADQSALETVEVIFSQKPRVESRLHFGCRIVETPQGHLFLTLGERYQRMADAQKLDNHLGKVVRIDKNGKPATGNPFLGRAGALPEIWSYGHRNAQGATMGPGGRLWLHEHGPQGGTRSTCPNPAATTAGRSSRSARTTAAAGSAPASRPCRAWSSPCIIGYRRLRLPAWPS